MTFNLRNLLFGGAVVGVLFVAPIVALAQTNSAPDRMSPHPHAMEQLNLTADQKSQIDQIRQNTRSQIDAILTDDQRQQFKTTLSQGGDFRRTADAMNLTQDQKDKLRSIMESSRDQIAQILTPDQRQQLEQLRASHHHGHAGGPDGASGNQPAPPPPGQ